MTPPASDTVTLNKAEAEPSGAMQLNSDSVSLIVTMPLSHDKVPFNPKAISLPSLLMYTLRSAFSPGSRMPSPSSSFSIAIDEYLTMLPYIVSINLVLEIILLDLLCILKKVDTVMEVK